MRRASFGWVMVVLVGCAQASEDAGPVVVKDGGPVDSGAGAPDSPSVDSSPVDSSVTDTAVDSSVTDTAVDSSVTDTAVDSAAVDTSVDAPSDSGADAGKTDACSATEICNGLDDDCNGVVDNGCPSALSLGAPLTDSSVFGSATGGATAYDDTCPTGEVLVGLTTVTNSYLRQIQAICGKISLVENSSTTPHGFTVSIATGTTMPNHGTWAGTSATVMCPTDSMIVAVSARGGSLVDQLGFTCAPLTVTGGPGTFALARGATSTIGPVGGTGGSDLSPFSCPGVSVANRIHGRTGDGLDSVSFACTTPSLTIR